MVVSSAGVAPNLDSRAGDEKGAQRSPAPPARKGAKASPPPSEAGLSKNVDLFCSKHCPSTSCGSLLCSAGLRTQR